MGAWDVGVFDDDAARDVFDSLLVGNAYEQIAEWMRVMEPEEHYEYASCHCMLVSGAFIDAVLNGTDHSKDLGDAYGRVIDQLVGKDLDALHPVLLRRLDHVLNGASELKELWSENEELYPVWRANVQGLIDRLK
ncbi:MAG: DUF4259 domain-containing protein [Flavobacteriales bacterium]|jgi:hypothetical protein|nr:DUF4259 domain-containing protein [Flavobacteriales bacterium]MBK7941376.1 DUF4259 domain-containing protein [Flavobacteriales bacterium]MBK8949197.1 DUF4259 domain-containing protein [Flavobacteriales bacterium]MBK9701522.1 DUF4259 domain-containing protein [Flavobacteriales bacterium]